MRTHFYSQQWLFVSFGFVLQGKTEGSSSSSIIFFAIAGHIEQAERSAIRKSPQAHTHFFPLLPTGMVFVSQGLVLVLVQLAGGFDLVCWEFRGLRHPSE
jgi:hypothetical protein